MGAWPCPSENPAGAACTPRNQATSLTRLIGPDEETILKRSMLKLQRPASERKRRNSGPVDGCGPARTRGCWHPRGLLELGIDFQVAISADPASRAPPTSGAPASWLQVAFQPAAHSRPPGADVSCRGTVCLSQSWPGFTFSHPCAYSSWKFFLGLTPFYPLPPLDRQKRLQT